MHEVGLVTAAIAQALQVARDAGAIRVERLTFAINRDGHITPEAIQTLVAALSRGTLIEGAALEVDLEAAADPRTELTLKSIDVDVLDSCG